MINPSVVLATPRARRFIRYSFVSAANVAIGQALLIFAFGILRWPAVAANAFSAVLAAGPAYILSRQWVWQRTGRSHMLSEVLPFWSLALVGLAASTGAVSLAGNIATSVSTTRSTQTIFIAAAALLAYGIVWILRFAVLDRYVFAPSTP